MASSKKLSKAEYELLASFRFALRRFLRFSEDAAHGAGLTPQQNQALLAIKGFPGRDRVTIGELAERLQVAHHSAVGLVDRLAAEKLVAREPSEEDRRCVFIALTRHGEDVLEKLASAHRTQLRRIGPEILSLLGRLADGDE
ncbi:MAG: MarR family winged helix-turn-helix transcriptional regulator [Prosthecobacter sp.]